MQGTGGLQALFFYVHVASGEVLGCCIAGTPRPIERLFVPSGFFRPKARRLVVQSLILCR